MWGITVAFGAAALVAGAALAQSSEGSLNVRRVQNGTVQNVLDKPFQFDLDGDSRPDFEISIFDPGDVSDVRLEDGAWLMDGPRQEAATIKGLINGTGSDQTRGRVAILPDIFRSKLLREPRVTDPTMTPVMRDIRFPGDGFVQAFRPGETIGGDQESKLVFADIGVLYLEETLPDFTSEAAAPIGAEDSDMNDRIVNFSAGPLSRPDASIFIGLQVEREVKTKGEDGPSGSVSPFFGWAEITRGSVTVNQVGAQSQAGVGAAVEPIAAVPVPPALGLLAGALAFLGIAARRKRRAQA